MKILICSRNNFKHRCYWCNAFMQGLRRHGIDAQLYDGTGSSDCDILVAWGTRHQAMFGRHGIHRGWDTICVLERGYVGDRFFWTSVGFGGKLNGRATFRGPFDDGSRLATYFPNLLKPWRAKDDGYVLLLGQVPNDMSLHNVNVLNWYRKATEILKGKGYDVRFRRHPSAAAIQVRGAPIIGGSLQEAFDGCSFAVTYNSNSSVDAVIAGVPCITADIGSMAYEVTGHEFDKPPSPDRQKWAERLVWCQWNYEEMITGECWDQVRPT